MVSSKTAICNSPRPYTMYESLEEKSTCNPTFTSNSLSNLPFICWLVTNVPSFPANGELLTKKFNEIVGSSMEIAGRDSCDGSAHIVSRLSLYNKHVRTT